MWKEKQIFRHSFWSKLSGWRCVAPVLRPEYQFLAGTDGHADLSIDPVEGLNIHSKHMPSVQHTVLLQRTFSGARCQVPIGANVCLDTTCGDVAHTHQTKPALRPEHTRRNLSTRERETKKVMTTVK
jgi:hypothetical protein